MNPQTISIIGFAALALIMLLFACVVLIKIWRGDIDLNGLLTEIPKTGEKVDTTKASLSRFQFLIFTFVIAGLFLILSIESGTFVEIPQNVLILLGVSGGTYVVSKTVTPAKDKPPSTGDSADSPSSAQRIR